MKEILLLILGGVLANNYAFEKFFGVVPMLGYSRREHKLLAMGLAVTLVTVLTAAVAWPVQSLLEQYALGYMQIMVYVALILIIACLVRLIIHGLMHKSLGVYFPLIALNSVVLGLALENASKGLGYGQALAAALGAGLGFLAGLYLMAGVNSRIAEKHVPAAFRGLPIQLLAASIIAMVLVAFK